VRNTIVMLVLAILAAATWLVTWQRQDVEPLVDEGGSAEPLGYYARGARVSGTDADGRLTYRIFAERLDEVPGEELLQLTGVTVDYWPADDATWALSAASAKYARDGSEIELVGKVEVRNSPSGGSKQQRIATEQLLFLPDSAIAESDEPVEIRVGDWQLRAVGLRADLKEQTLKLESPVHGTLVAP
jgi:LPS export ABC transporter protein LptC